MFITCTCTVYYILMYMYCMLSVNYISCSESIHVHEQYIQCTYIVAVCIITCIIR